MATVLDPIALETSTGFRSTELREVRRLIVEHRADLQERWSEFFDQE